MLKTMLTVAVLTLAPVIPLSATHAGGYPGGNGAGQTGRPFPGDTGLPAHHGEPDVKPPKPQPMPQDVVVRSNHIPPIIHGPFPGPRPAAPRAARSPRAVNRRSTKSNRPKREAAVVAIGGSRLLSDSFTPTWLKLSNSADAQGAEYNLCYSGSCLRLALPTDQVCRQIGQPVGFIFCITKLECHAFSFNKAGVRHTLFQGRDEKRRVSRRSAAQDRDHGQRRILRACGTQFACC